MIFVCYIMISVKHIKKAEVVIMSYSSKKNLISVIAWVALLIAYAIYTMGGNAPATEDVKTWAIAILVFIGIGLGVQCVVQILFHIALSIGIAVKEGVKAGDKKSAKNAERILKAEMVEDEWSKLIDLKAARVGFLFVALGVIASLISLAVGAEIAVALHVLFGMFVLASVAIGIASIIYHERGGEK